jgi:Flp pilus assembly protein TadG
MRSFFEGPTRAVARMARFRQDQSGNVAIVMALIAVVMMLSIGAAVDLGRWLHARDQTISAVDAAVLAGGRALQVNSKDQAAAIAAAQKYYIQNVTSRLPVTDDTVSFAVAPDGMGVVASGSAYIKTPFLQFAAIDKLALISRSQTQFSKSEIQVGGNGGQNVEISLILDVTGSMAGSKIVDLRDAAKKLVDIVIWEDQSEFYAKVAVIPYSMGVNVGTYAQKVRGSVSPGTCTSEGCNNFKFTNTYNQSKTFAISTCVSERKGSNAFTEVAPSTAPLGRNYPAPGNPCLSNQIVPLSSDKEALKTKISGLAASGSTAGHVGVAWGWYMLSPNFGYLWPSSMPAPYTDLKQLGPKGAPKLRKIAILMSDGEYNSAYCKGVISQDSTNGSGDAADHINCNAPNGSSFTQAGTLCTNMKKTGIEVFTIGFDIVNDQRARDLMTNCATDPSKVYMATDGEQLKQAFLDIALKLSSLYISK